MLHAVRRWLGAAALLMAAPVGAQIITSAGPEAVAVTVYRDTDRDAEQAIDLDWLGGYALVTETRRVTIPAGTATLRFEGVAGGILPESAIVTGLPAGVSEKNLDADLLSPRSLYDRSLNRPVTVRRTYPDGRVVEEPAVIRSASEGAMVVQTREGVEALQCSGLPEAIVYDGVPPGLSAKPTLSVQTSSTQAHQATVTLSYLAWGFDWQANYVVEMDDRGDRARLFAWVTLASGDETSFVDAGTSVVAGKLNRESTADETEERPEPELHVLCEAVEALPPPPPPPPIPAPMTAMAPMVQEERARDIVVTGARMARQEELGDLKLYRVPFPTTVAAQAQKQVAMLDKAGVPVSIVYAVDVQDDDASDAMITLRTRNRQAEGLGVPLPAGGVAAFAPGGQGRLLIGEGHLADKAVGEDVEIAIAEASGVVTDVEEDEDGLYTLTVTNDRAAPVAYEVRFLLFDGERLEKPSRRLGRKDGRPIWPTTLPANSETRLTYRIRKPA